VKTFSVLFLILFTAASYSQSVIDNFETTEGWENRASDEVEINTSVTEGFRGRCIRIDFHFKTGTGFCGITKSFPVKLPENFKYSFYIKGNAPVNNLEFKLVDKSGDNVWWYNQRSYTFAQEWTKVSVKKRNIEFAWGPTTDKSLSNIEQIEIIVASATGGKGTIYIDELAYEELEPLTADMPQPIVLLSSNENENNNLMDGNPDTQWNISNKDESEIIIDLKKNREYGGLIIDWDTARYASKYNIDISGNSKDWERIYAVQKGSGGKRYINLKDNESRYIRLQLLESSNNNKYIIKDITVKDYKFSDTPEHFFSELAKEYPRGYFPRYTYNEQSFWTIVGVNNDTKEALFNHDGALEIDQRQPSIIPYLFDGKQLRTWNDVERTQKLENNYLPVPSVTWKTGNLLMDIKTFSAGEVGNSVTYVIYKLKNTGREKQSGNLYLAVSPFQVNPPWQWLNNPGGVSKINSINFDGNVITLNNQKQIVPVSKPDGFGVTEFDSGYIVEFLRNDQMPDERQVKDHTGFASAALKYSYLLKPGEEKVVYIAVPFFPENYKNDKQLDEAFVNLQLKNTIDFWEKRLSTAQFNLPASGKKLIDIIKSNLAYILINRDKAGIQPGSRSYERSWIRDGSLTSSALLKLGVKEEVKAFIEWYSKYQFENGKVPCVVDNRGPDPVPENDSHGQLIFAIMQYYRFTKDTSFLRAHFNNVVKAIDYMEYLINQRKTEYYKNGNDSLKLLYGLLPESISHEGYSAKPMHSYWDDFFGLLGFKNAVEIAEVLNEKTYLDKFTALRNEFRTDLYRSIDRSVQYHQINYIPGAAELGDFDATSTAIAIYPCGEKNNLPQNYLDNTFDMYYKHFMNRLNPSFSWENYTPYEVRVIGTFIYLNQIERAHELIKFFLDDQYPTGWNHWAEVVWKDSATAKFIGDMPHTWVGSDFISAVRAMFVFEDEYQESIVVGAGLFQDWLNTPNGISINNLPTYYGNINYSIKPDGRDYIMNISGDVEIPKGKIRFRNIWGKDPKKVTINGMNQTLKNQEIVIHKLPAEVKISF